MSQLQVIKESHKSLQEYASLTKDNALAEKFDKLEGYPRTSPKTFVYSMREVRCLVASLDQAVTKLERGIQEWPCPQWGLYQRLLYEGTGTGRHCGFTSIVSLLLILVNEGPANI